VEWYDVNHVFSLIEQTTHEGKGPVPDAKNKESTVVSPEKKVLAFKGFIVARFYFLYLFIYYLFLQY
jgi:hypothetical protein